MPGAAELSAIPQEIVQAMMNYQQTEMVWLDAVIRAQWPAWVCNMAEGDRFYCHLMRVFVARFSGLDCVRNQNTSITGKATKKQMLDSITTTVYKHVRACKLVTQPGGIKRRPTCGDSCVLARQKFTLNIPI